MWIQFGRETVKYKQIGLEKVYCSKDRPIWTKKSFSRSITPDFDLLLSFKKPTFILAIPVIRFTNPQNPAYPKHP